MSSQLALLQVHLVCQYLIPLNPSGIDIINGALITSNELAILNLDIARQSLPPLNLPCVSINQTEEKKNPHDQTLTIDKDPKPDSQKPLQSSSSGKLAKDLPNEYTVYPYIGVAYKFYREGKSWTEARDYCQREGANLAVIDTFEKAKYVSNLKGSTSPPDTYIGIHRFTDDNEYVGIKSGEKLGTLPWIQMEHFGDLTRKCAVVPYVGGGIVAAHCHLPYSFVCEVSLVD